MNEKLIKKSLDDMVFKHPEIEYSFRFNEPTLYSPKGLLLIDVFVDVDKMIPEFDSYDREYQYEIYEIPDNVYFAFSLIGVSNYDITFEYGNMDRLDQELSRLTNEFRNQLYNKYEIPRHVISDSDIGFYFYGSESENVYMRIEFWSNYYLEDDDGEDLVKISEVQELAEEIWKTSSLYSELELDMVYGEM
jgi:hypothetical protein